MIHTKGKPNWEKGKTRYVASFVYGGGGGIYFRCVYYVWIIFYLIQRKKLGCLKEIDFIFNFPSSEIYIYIYRLVNSRLRRDFPRPPGEWRLQHHLWAPSPQMVLKTWPVPWGFQICAWFWNRTTGKWGASGAPCFGRLWRPFQGAPAAPMVLKTSAGS